MLGELKRLLSAGPILPYLRRQNSAKRTDETMWLLSKPVFPVDVITESQCGLLSDGPMGVGPTEGFAIGSSQ